MKEIISTIHTLVKDDYTEEDIEIAFEETLSDGWKFTDQPYIIIDKPDIGENDSWSCTRHTILPHADCKVGFLGNTFDVALDIDEFETAVKKRLNAIYKYKEQNPEDYQALLKAKAEYLKAFDSFKKVWL